ncbi:MAG TPA: FAD-binding oxidoreductase [Actinophytocola sp.]|uniref:FAD-binding oxidoreductase n=1 Tax=Actinophytocola sp. TaxID=1872138 RepID=UPI002DB8757E|nr:FAD-binding oxidoreductase [Actinophytocola sp.]HEU5473527.1 FAD-binding oxidoreductase [Actinophytocola sp.]
MDVLNQIEAENFAVVANGGTHRSVLDAAARVVGADRVISPDAAPLRLGPNVGRFRARNVLGVIRPRGADEVRQVIEIFATSPHSGALHPVSTGRNWGLGSREPATDNAVVLDLSGLDRIRGIDLTGGWAVVEPGVTQGRLAHRLLGTERTVNLTASSMHTSVVGNVLDRGVGLRSQRVDDLLGLEVVLPDGELIRVGWWPDPDRPAPVYPHGLGPDPLGMFVQSNLGVVTAAAVRLPPRPEAVRVVRLNFAPERLAAVMDVLRRWVAQGLARGVPKVYNPVAARPYRGTEGKFLAHVCVEGTAAAVDALSALVTAEAAATGLFSEISDTDSADPGGDNHEVATLVERSYAGVPDTDDVLFRAKMRRPGAEVDRWGGGFLFFLPMVPLSGAAVAHAHELLDRVHENSGIRCGTTQNLLGPDLVDFVVTMRFEPDAPSVERAHRALELMYGLFTEAGFVPYRLDVDHAGWMDRLSPDPAARRFVRRLKEMLDPDGVIAPGRYS